MYRNVYNDYMMNEEYVKQKFPMIDHKGVSCSKKNSTNFITNTTTR